jgi:hypothetical protein
VETEEHGKGTFTLGGDSQVETEFHVAGSGVKDIGLERNPRLIGLESVGCRKHKAQEHQGGKNPAACGSLGLHEHLRVFMDPRRGERGVGVGDSRP